MVKLKYYFQKPEKGFDPVPLGFAKQYAASEYKKFNTRVIDEMGIPLQSFNNKTVLDLGGGPGQYSLEFAKRGAKVTWHDISKNYLDIAKSKAEHEHLNINFSIGYLEQAKGKFDIIFNRICWYYCLNDYQFAHHLYTLINEGGYGYIIVNNEEFLENELKKESFFKRLIIKASYWINETLDIKLTHVHPSHRKLNRIFSSLKFKRLQVYRKGDSTLITFNK